MRGEHGDTKIASTEAKGFAGPSRFTYYLSSRLTLRGKMEGRLKTGQRVLLRVMPQRALRSACYLTRRRNLVGSPQALSRAFSVTFGRSPTAYRRQNAKSK